MTVQEVKSIYMDHCAVFGYEAVPSSLLVNDSLPTAFVMSVGLLQLEPVLLGTSHSRPSDFAMVQRCIRHYDMDIVGQGDRLSFFEMGGAISCGSRSADETVRQLVALLLEKLGLPRDHLVFTIFGGGEFRGRRLPPDEQSYDLLRQHGIDDRRIKRLGIQRNFFGIASREEFCGPSLETFVVRSKDTVSPKEPSVTCDDLVEIGNTVFLNLKKSDSGLEPLDTVYSESAIGIERTALALSSQRIIYDLPEIATARDLLERSVGLAEHRSLPPNAGAVSADHLRAVVFAIADGAEPGHGGRRYVLRKLIRRMLVRLDTSNACFPRRLREVVDVLADANRHVMPLSSAILDRVVDVVLTEGEVFKGGQADPERYIGATRRSCRHGEVQ